GRRGRWRRWLLLAARHEGEQRDEHERRQSQRLGLTHETVSLSPVQGAGGAGAGLRPATRVRAGCQPSGGMFSFWPGNILFGSFSVSLLASKIFGHLFASPYSCFAIFERL